MRSAAGQSQQNRRCGASIPWRPRGRPFFAWSWQLASDDWMQRAWTGPAQIRGRESKVSILTFSHCTRKVTTGLRHTQETQTQRHKHVTTTGRGPPPTISSGGCSRTRTSSEPAPSPTSRPHLLLAVGGATATLAQLLRLLYRQLRPRMMSLCERPRALHDQLVRAELLKQDEGHRVPRKTGVTT